MSEEEEPLMTFSEFKRYLISEGHPLLGVSVGSPDYRNVQEYLYHFMVLRVMDQGVLYPSDIPDPPKVAKLTRKEWHSHAAAFFASLAGVEEEEV